MIRWVNSSAGLPQDPAWWPCPARPGGSTAHGAPTPSPELTLSLALSQQLTGPAARGGGRKDWSAAPAVAPTGGQLGGPSKKLVAAPQQSRSGAGAAGR